MTIKISSYKLLEVKKTSSHATIKASYRRLSLLYHPDVNKHPRAEEIMKAISQAYTSLCNKNTTEDILLQIDGDTYLKLKHFKLNRCFGLNKNHKNKICSHKKECCVVCNGERHFKQSIGVK